MRKAARTRTATPPIAMPAIAPVDSAGDELLVAAAGTGVNVAVFVDVDVEELDVEDDAVVLVGTTSEGKNSPGENINVAFFA